MKILAVDDDESILTLLNHALVSSGRHDVTTAVSAKSALETIGRSEQSFDCLLIDIQMPEIDGIQLTECIRRTPGYERPPVLMLTAMHEKVYLDRAFWAGATDYVTKPFDLSDLNARISDAEAMTREKVHSGTEVYRQQNVRWVRGIARDDKPDQAIASSKINTLISYSEFDNYVLELARRPNCKAIALAVKMADPSANRHAEASSEEFATMLRNFVTCTSAALADSQCTFSYRGNGTLLCVMAQEPGMPSELIEREINARFKDISTLAGFTSLRVFVGDPTPISTISDAEVFERLWRATDSVERRFVACRGIIIPKRILNQGVKSAEQHRLERKSYKSTLRRMLTEIEDERWLDRLYRKAGQRKEQG